MFAGDSLQDSSYSSFDPVASAISSSCNLELGAGKLVSDIHPHFAASQSFLATPCCNGLAKPSETW